MDESRVELIQAPRWERIATAAVYLLLGLFGVATVFLGLIPGAAAAPLIVTGAIMAVLGCVVSVRARRVAVTLSADRLQYFGFTSSCSMPKDAIAAVLDTATVEWRGPAGGPKSCAVAVPAGVRRRRNQIRSVLAVEAGGVASGS